MHRGILFRLHAIRFWRRFVITRQVLLSLVCSASKTLAMIALLYLIVTITVLVSAADPLDTFGSGAQGTTRASEALQVTVSASPSTVFAGYTAVGTVNLNASAPAGGVNVTLTSSDTSVFTVPASVTILAGQKSATFTITARAVSSQSQRVITATYGTSSASFFTVKPILLDGVGFDQSWGFASHTATGTVKLNALAPAGGINVTLTSSDTSVVTVPAAVTVLTGQKSATFTSTTGSVTSQSSSTITAIYGISKSTSFTVQPISVILIKVDPPRVIAGYTATGTVFLNTTAPAGGFTVTPASAKPSTAMVPASVIVPAGSNLGTFTITTSSVPSQSPSTITATPGVAASKPITVLPILVRHFEVNPLTVFAGGTATGTVIINNPAPAGGFNVTVTSSIPAVASVPAFVTIPAGSSSASFTIKAGSVTNVSQNTIKVATPGNSDSRPFTVKPPVP